MKAKFYETEVEYFDGAMVNGVPTNSVFRMPFKVTGNDRVRRTVEKAVGKRVILIGYKVRRVDLEFDVFELPPDAVKSETVVYDSMKEQEN